MISETAALAAIRFGYGLAPDERPPEGPSQVMRQLGDGKDVSYDGPGVPDRIGLAREAFQSRRRHVRAKGTAQEAAAAEEMRVAHVAIRRTRTADTLRLFTRAVSSPTPFLERLTMFWADHFTVEWITGRTAVLGAHMIETVIRPGLTGYFPEMLKAVTRHPGMLEYLSQQRSTGPNSTIGKRRGLGLNENLAREILELHTMGVDSGYSQGDVRQFAELLTGYSYGPQGFRYVAQRAEPGAETVLGVDYGGPAGRIADVEAALEDIALRPETARYLARKLVTHFIGDGPNDALIAELARTYLDARGRLLPVYRALVHADAAWQLPLKKAKTPFEFAVSTARAMGASRDRINPLTRRNLAQGYVRPMDRMGQSFMRPGGPNGWPEEPEAWITPAGLAARIEWARNLSPQIAQVHAPRAFMESTLGPLASGKLKFAVAGAETRFDAITMVLASPEFNRR